MEQSSKGHRKTLVGDVVSDRMDKTVVVAINRLTKHPLYGKYVNRCVKYMAHDEKNECKEGDRVMIAESRPLSRHKRWIVKRIMVKQS